MAWNSMKMGCASRRLLLPVAALALTFASVAAVPGADPAAPIAAAAGHPSTVHLHAEAAAVRDGESVVETLDAQGTQRLARSCAGGLCRGRWFDGRRTFTFGINGTPLPEPGDDERERTFAAIASTAFAEPDFAAAGGTVVRLPGDDEMRFRVTAPQGTALVAVADPRTHRLERVEQSDGLPYRRLHATVAGPLTLYADRAYDRVSAAAGPLVPPEGPAVSFAAAGARAGPAPGELPIVPCTLAHRDAACLIDTGTSPSAITLEFAERLGEEPRGRIEIGGFAGYLTGVVDAGPLTLGTATFTRLSLAVVPRAHGANFDVIVGSDALAMLRVEFDRPARSIRVLAAGTEPPAGNAIPLSFADGVPYVQVRLAEQTRTEPMLFDTGDSGTLSIGYDEYRDDLALFAAHGAGEARGIGETRTSTLTGTLDRAVIGGETLESLPISAVRGQHVGHVGFGFVGRCAHFTLEVGRREIACGEPSPQPAAPRDSGR